MNYLDLTASDTPRILDRAIDDERAWCAADVDAEHCVIKLDHEASAEIDRIVTCLRANPLPVLLRAPRDFEMPVMTALMAHAKTLLDRTGIAVIDALPMESMTRDESIAVFWLLGQCLGQPVAQKWDGTILYDVKDTGQTYSYGVRGSATNVELVFHNDNAFGAVVPQYVGLLCLRPAQSGGTSRFCSLYAIHNRLLEAHPEQLRRLYYPVLWDRQAEHADGQPTVAQAPVFEFDGTHLSARINVSLIRKGYDVAGETMDTDTRAALEALASVAEDPALWFELPLQAGHLQYLNNRETAHYRSEFTDHADPDLKRHVVRTWHRDVGAPTYDG